MKLKISIVFVFTIILVAYYYNYWEIMHKRPQSVHNWRQTDCASIALNYYKHGMHFFKPEVMFQISDGGKSGYTVGECPILYYLIAILWKIFGYSDFLYRFTNFLIFLVGLFCLHRILLVNTIKDAFWSVAVPLLVFISPVVVYYANNFITDTTSLSLIFIGWLFFIKYYNHKKNSNFLIAVLFFTIAGLIKVSSLISVFAILGIFFLKFMRIGDSKMSSFFKLNLKKALPLILMFVCIISWYVFSHYYNKLHNAFTSDGTPYFSAQTYPIWNLSIRDIVEILHEIKNIWLPDYFHFSVFILFSSVFILFVWFFKRINYTIKLISLLLFIGVCLFILMWFYAFGQHDYYIINLLIFPLFLFIVFLNFLKDEMPLIFNSFILKLCFIAFLIFNIHYAKHKLVDRYFGWQNEFPKYQDVHTITPYLRELGISENDKVISLPDPATCYTLYLMNQSGWSGTNFNYSNEQMKNYISLGAKFLIITNPDIKNRLELIPYLNNQIGQYGIVSIYRLQ